MNAPTERVLHSGYMKSWHSTWVVVATLVATVAVPAGLGAQAKEKRHPRYKFVDVGTLGGPASDIPAFQKDVNRHGVAVGGANTITPDPTCFNPLNPHLSNCFAMHAFRYQNGGMADLGTLPGGTYSFAQDINDHGLVGGSSDNGLVDPLLGTPQFHAVVWKKNNQIIDLGTLGGGFESQVIGLNKQGQAVGYSQNLIPEPFPFPFIGPFPTQTRAFLWQAGAAMQDLGTLGGSDSFAVMVNNKGQAIGGSYTNVVPSDSSGPPTLDPFVWEKGAMVDLGTLGGDFGFAEGINDRGQISGFSNLAGDGHQHPFLWEAGVMTDLGALPGGDDGDGSAINDDGEVVGWASNGVSNHASSWKNGLIADLGTVPGDNFSFAESVNSKAQIVGYSFDWPCGSCEFGPSHAFLYEKGGPMIDLNTLIPPNKMALVEADIVTDRGIIGGVGVPAGGADLHGFLMIPCGDDTQESCADDPGQQDVGDDGE